MISFRIMEQEDITEGLRLCRSAKWNQLQSDWEIFLNYRQDDCRVAIYEGKVAGTVTAIRYEGRFSWIGMVLVDPSLQRKGIGSGLLHEALQLLNDEETVKLDATPAGRQVYLPLGFQDEYQLSRMNAIVMPENIRPSPARPMKKEDLDAVAAFDRDIFGAGRGPLLTALFEGAPGLAFIMEDGNEIKGYCLGRSGHTFTQIGPIVAGNRSAAEDLSNASLAVCIGQPVIIDAMHHDLQWLSWLAAAGFSEQRPFTRMYKGKNNYPGIPEKQFAIAGPEFG